MHYILAQYSVAERWNESCSISVKANQHVTTAPMLLLNEILVVQRKIPWPPKYHTGPIRNHLINDNIMV